LVSGLLLVVAAVVVGARVHSGSLGLAAMTVSRVSARADSLAVVVVVGNRTFRIIHPDYESVQFVIQILELTVVGRHVVDVLRYPILR
jgi:hypothetical protein